uniref:F-box domain-containing protein n=1 Tax=Meloidogyne hapla TaxID=6305 RepID=A0A1I8BJQ9_MELHA
MYNLPLESKLDIFKHLNINQLTSVRQTNNYFNALIGRYEGELARKKLYSIEITECSQDYNYKSINPQDGVFHFKITSQLMEKVK